MQACLAGSAPHDPLHHSLCTTHFRLLLVLSAQQQRRSRVHTTPADLTLPSASKSPPGEPVQCADDAGCVGPPAGLN